MKIFHVTQDGIARLSLKNPSLDGLFTDGVETCIVWIIKGSESLTMIHDTKCLLPQAILDEISMVGALKELYVVYNPQYNLLENVKQYVNSIIGSQPNILKQLKFLLCRNAFVEVFLNKFRINTITKTTNCSCLEPLAVEHRKRVNIFNNLFLLENEFMIPDLQYNQGIQHVAPQFNKELDVMLNILLRLNNNTEDFVMNFVQLLCCYMYLNMKDGSYSSLCKKILDCIESQNIQYTVLEILKELEPNTLNDEYNKVVINERIPEIKQNNQIKLYDYCSDKHIINDTSLIIYLNAFTNLKFFALCNGDYDVDAVLDLTDNKVDLYPCCEQLLPYGKFFHTNDNRQLFVIQKINAKTDEDEQNIGKEVYKIVSG